MGIIPEEHIAEIREIFDAKLKDEVKIIVFSQEFECEYCKETRQLMKEVADLSDKISVEIYDFGKERDLAEKYGVDKIPAIVLLGKKDYGVRYFGLPSGYEFTTLIQDIIDVSEGATDLSSETKEKLMKIDKPVHIQVFVTPTCPYCPRAVRTAHQLAVESEWIRGDMIESIEFPHLAQKYAVMAVPKVVINEKTSFEGAMPEEYFVERIFHALYSD